MDHLFTVLPWDSEFFQFKTGRVDGEVLSQQDITSIDFLVKKNNVMLTYFSTRNEIETKLLDLSDLNWTLVDRKLVYTKLIGDPRPMHNFIGAYNGRMDIKEKLLSLSVQSGVYSRFNVDKNIGRSNFERMYQLWMENSLDKRIALEVLLYTENQDPAGFVTLGEKNGRGDIGIIAVDHEFRGRGIGKELMFAAESWFRDNGFNEIQVITQGDNVQACKLYEGLGYQIESKNYFYHIWNMNNKVNRI